MSTHESAATVVQRLVDVLDAQQWDALPALLRPGFECDYVHTGERFDAEGFVAVNRDYPGSWRLTCEELVSSREHAVARIRVSDDAATYYVASFATVHDGRISSLTEVWTEAVTTAPERNQA